MLQHVKKLFLAIIAITCFTCFQRADYNLPLFAFAYFLWDYKHPFVIFCYDIYSPKNPVYSTYSLLHGLSILSGWYTGVLHGVQMSIKIMDRQQVQLLY